MSGAFGRFVLAGVASLVLASGCGGEKPPEVKPDPALAGKPFPKVSESKRN